MRFILPGIIAALLKAGAAPAAAATERGTFAVGAVVLERCTLVWPISPGRMACGPQPGSRAPAPSPRLVPLREEGLLVVEF